MDSTPPDNGYLPPSSVQIKTAKTQKHLYCPVFTSRGYKKDIARENPDFIGVFTVYTAKYPRTVLTDIKMMFSLCWMS